MGSSILKDYNWITGGAGEGNTVEVFDYIIMAVGSLLILIGLFLFISGKKESAKSNQLEGFGIKLNISNPSIILIVFGIGLLLVPRLLPKNYVEPTPKPNPTPIDGPFIESEKKAELENNGSLVEPGKKPEVIPVPRPLPSIFLPVGTWQLSGYELDGVDISGNSQASIYFEGQSSTNTAWAANFMFVDDWGNISNYQYQGIISGNGSAYNIAITTSSDPNFFAQGATPLDLTLENGGVLHMGYMFNGTDILLHWIQ